MSDTYEKLHKRIVEVLDGELIDNGGLQDILRAIHIHHYNLDDMEIGIFSDGCVLVNPHDDLDSSYDLTDIDLSQKPQDWPEETLKSLLELL